MVFRVVVTDDAADGGAVPPIPPTRIGGGTTLPLDDGVECNGAREGSGEPTDDVVAVLSGMEGAKKNASDEEALAGESVVPVLLKDGGIASSRASSFGTNRGTSMHGYRSSFVRTWVEGGGSGVRVRWVRGFPKRGGGKHEEHL